MTRDDCLIAVVPFFVPSSQSPRLTPSRLPCRPSCRRASRADCLPRNRSAADDAKQFVLSEMIRDARQIVGFHLRRVLPYIPIRRKAGIPISHHDENSFPSHAPHMRHGERGEVAAVCLPTRPVSTRYGGGDRHIPHRGNQIGRIRFAHFPWMADFPVALSHRRVIL